MTSTSLAQYEPIKLTNEINVLIDRMKAVDLVDAPMVEPYLLAPFWAVGDFVNVSGSPGSGKSLLAADVVLGALHPARQGRALGGLLRFAGEQLAGGKVAILDGENSRVRWSSILRRKLVAEDLDPFKIKWAPLHVRPSDVNIQNPGNWERASIAFAKSLASVNVRFLVIDTLGRAWAPEDINSSSWVQRGLAPFRTACQQYGISALLLSHTKRRKNADDPHPTGPIGTSFQEGQVDAQIIMSRVKGGDGLTLTHQKSRRSFWIQQGSKVTLHFKPGLGYEPQADWQTQWPHECPDYDAKDLEPDPSTRSRLLQILRDKSPAPISRHELQTQLGLSERAVRKQLAALSDAGLAEQVGRSSDTQWRLKPSC